MPNKTIYVSQKDEALFEEAKRIAGEALSSVISRALGEYIARNKDLEKGMKEVKVSVGPKGSEHEQRFVGRQLGTWRGFSDDKTWWLAAFVYHTQKGNWAVHLTTICKASLLTDHKAWKKSGDYLAPGGTSELFVAETPDAFEGRLPKELFGWVQARAERQEKPIKYLDI